MANPQIMPATGLGGGKNISVEILKGPASYVTGGVTVGAQAFNLARVDFVSAMDITTDGLNFVNFVSVGVAGGATTVVAQWFVQATGLQVGNGVNLSAKRIMCLAIGV